jgi:hypothetical protein
MFKVIICIFTVLSLLAISSRSLVSKEQKKIVLVYRGPINRMQDSFVAQELNSDSTIHETRRLLKEVLLDPDGKFSYYADGTIEHYNISSGLSITISGLVRNNHSIEDISLTAYNQWVVIFNQNRYLCSNIPHELKLELDDYRRHGQSIHTITLTDNNDWLIIGDSSFSTSAEHVKHYIDYGQQKFGPIKTAHFDDQSLVVILQNGNVTYGQVPDKVKRAVATGSKTINRLRYIQNGSYFIRYADESSDLAILY